MVYPPCLFCAVFYSADAWLSVLTQVLPALDPNTPIFAGAFTMQLVRRRLQEFSLFNEHRFRTFKMRDQFQAGPFE